MTRTEIDEKVREFLIDDLEIKPEEMADVKTLSQFCDYIEGKVK